jgi:hypothetical protein
MRRGFAAAMVATALTLAFVSAPAGVTREVLPRVEVHAVQLAAATTTTEVEAAASTPSPGEVVYRVTSWIAAGVAAAGPPILSRPNR